MTCRHVAEGCRGCKLIGLSYDTQLLKKREQLQSTFRLIGLDALVEPVVASPKQFGYRERASFVSLGNGELGMKGLDGRIIPTKECRVVAPAILGRAFSSGHRGGGTSFVSVGEVAISNGDQPSCSPLRVPLPNGQFLYCHPDVFGQANREVTSIIAERISSLTTGTRLLELYCGSGALTVPLTRRFRSITGVEISAAAVDLLKRAVREQGLSEKVTALCANVAQYLASQRVDADVVLLNPPWSGIPQAVCEAVGRLQQPRELFYLACNPLTLARDVERFVRLG